MEESPLRLLKKFMLVVIGSGLLSNALYIHGLAFYEGYIDRLGFEYDLFPLDNSDVLFWTYTASREIGVSSILAMAKFKVSIIFIFLAVVYLLSRLWMESSMQASREYKKRPIQYNRKLAKKAYTLKKERPIIFWVIYVPLRWLFLKEQSIMAFK